MATYKQAYNLGDMLYKGSQLLRAKENPLEVCETPEDLLKDNKNNIISRKLIYKYLRDLYSL